MHKTYLQFVLLCMQHFRWTMGWQEKTIWTYTKSWIYLTSVLKLIGIQWAAPHSRNREAAYGFPLAPGFPEGHRAARDSLHLGKALLALEKQPSSWYVTVFQNMGHTAQSRGTWAKNLCASIKGKPTNCRLYRFFCKVPRKPTSSRIESRVTFPFIT